MVTNPPGRIKQPGNKKGNWDIEERNISWLRAAISTIKASSNKSRGALRGDVGQSREVLLSSNSPPERALALPSHSPFNGMGTSQRIITSFGYSRQGRGF